MTTLDGAAASAASARVLYLVRHGESTWNLLRRLQGQVGAPPLTARGRRQAEIVAAKLSHLRAVGLLSSDAVRAQQTAAVVSGEVGLPVRTTRLLRERHWGFLQGGPARPAEKLGSELAFDERPEGGESRRDVQQRLLCLMGSALMWFPAGPVIVVSHGDVIVEAVRLWRGSRSGTVPANGTVTVLVTSG